MDKVHRTIVVAFGVVPAGVSVEMLSQPRFAAIWLAFNVLCAELEDDFDGELAGDGRSEVADAEVEGSSDDPEFEVA